MKRNSILGKVSCLAVCAGIIAGCLLNQGKLYSQDTRYTQSYNAPLRLNPALMGPNTDLKGILNYRTQWANIYKGYTTYRFTFLSPLMMTDNSGKLDIGLSAVNDVAGVFSTLNISLALGYALNISKDHHISAALIGGYGQKTLDTEGGTYDEQYVLGSYDANNPSNESILNENLSYPDLGFGLLWYMSPDGDVAPFVGVSASHFNTPDESMRGEFGDYPVFYNYHGGVKIAGEKFDFTPNLRISKQGGAEDYEAGCYIDYKINDDIKIPFGLWYRYRKQNAFAVMLSFEHKNFLLAYSYDFASFEMTKPIPNSTTHEITLGFMKDRAKDKKSKSLY